MTFDVNKYYENGIFVENSINNYKYVCKICQAKGKFKEIKSLKSSMTNLMKHIRTHKELKLPNEDEIVSSPSLKRPRIDSPSIHSQTSNNTTKSTSTFLVNS
jgi:hypothetical protein